MPDYLECLFVRKWGVRKLRIHVLYISDIGYRAIETVHHSRRRFESVNRFYSYMYRVVQNNN